MECEEEYFSTEDSVGSWPFLVENITVVQAPLLKIYYWESLDIEGLNEKLKSEESFLVHNLYIPTAQHNSCQLRIVLWIRDTTTEGTDISLKRRQNCDCTTYPTRVGFNQYRKLYHCPHRHLLNVNQERIVTKPGEMVALSFVIYFYFLGEHKLTYELRCGKENFTLILNFFLDIVCFDVTKCLITKELIPVEMTEPRKFVQALWVRNITMNDLKLTYSTKNRGLKIINSSLHVPRQSVWPLMVEFRPSGPIDKLQITQTYEKLHTTHDIIAKGCFGSMELTSNMPLRDYDCHLHRFIIFPNKLEFNVGQDEERTLMVNIHNFEQKCVEFHWQNYVINNLFSITYAPETFRLKPHHSKLCVVNLRSFDRPLHFVRVPLVLEVHRIFDRSTQIAKDLLSEIESIDDPKWKEESYMEHVLLQLDLKINFKMRPTVDLGLEPITHSSILSELPFDRNKSLTIFEKLFWEYLSQSDFMRPNKNLEINNRLSYAQVFDMNAHPPQVPRPPDLTKNIVLKLVSLVMAEAIHDISKNWIFIPSDSYEKPI